MNLDALLAPIPDKTNQCKVRSILAELQEPYKSAAVKLLSVSYRAGGLSDAGVRARFVAAGFDVSQPVIYRHRNGQCSCESVVVE